MLNYDFTIEAYEQLLKKYENNEQMVESISSKLAAMRLLNGRSENEVYSLFDTGVFNDIVKNYVKSAVGNAGYSEYAAAILDELRFLFDAVGAKEICEAHKNADN